MRKTSSSSKCSWITVFSSRAEARSWPKGFSTIRRVHPVGDLVLAAFVREVRGHVGHALGERVPDLLLERVARVLLHRLLHPLTELVVGLLAARDAEPREVLRKRPPERERVERREELLRRQVAGGAEDDEHARVRRRADLEPLEERVLFALRPLLGDRHPGSVCECQARRDGGCSRRRTC